MCPARNGHWERIGWRRPFEVARFDGDFGNLKPEKGGLKDDLCVKQEVVGIAEEGNALQQTPTVSAVTGVILAQMQAQGNVLDRREEAVGDQPVERHRHPSTPSMRAT